MLDMQLAGTYVNLADAYRVQGHDDKGGQVLRRGLALLPHAADLHHALGLLLVRKGDKAAAVSALEQAARRAPDNARYAYVYAVALHSTGHPGKALAVLHDADIRHPNTPDILGTLVTLYREAGDTPAALIYARKLAAAMPDDPEVQRLLAELGGTK